MVISGILGFLGFGNMGEAIFKGLIEAGTLEAGNGMAFDLDESRLKRCAELGGQVADSPAHLAKDSGVLILATKPQDMGKALVALDGHVAESTLVVSIAAGVAMRVLSEGLSGHARLARVMPNTPALVNAGAAGVAFSPACTSEDEEAVLGIFESIGIAEKVPEDAMDTVTALSGSGPAYCFYLAECLADAAVGLGLAPEQATRLAAQTLYGAGLLLKESGESAASLREKVTSKGGTTAAALDAFRAKGFSEVIRAGVEAAAERSGELGA